MSASKLAEGLGIYVKDLRKCLFAYQDAGTSTWFDVTKYDDAPGPQFTLAFGKAGQRNALAETVCIDLPSLVNAVDFACALLGWSTAQRLHAAKCMIGRLCWDQKK